MRLKSIHLCLALGLTGLIAEAAGDARTFEIDALLVQMSVEEGDVFITQLASLDDQDDVLDRKLGPLVARVRQHLAASEELEERRFSDEESLYRGTNYARKLVAKIELLEERVAFLGGRPAFTQAIEAAAKSFDVPAIKKLLQHRLELDDDSVAEAAFQLGGFQELDGEYQDAWANYQKASNLEPDNQLYMDAHGKNEF